jgi:hypothetical protein
MAGRSTYHDKKQKEREKEKKGPPAKKKVAIAIGKPYTVEELQKLIAALASDELEVEMGAVAEFAENHARISAGAAKAPDISETKMVEQLIEVVLKNQEKMLNRFEKERRNKVLLFLARSSSIPPKLRDKAAAVLKRLGLEEEKKAVEPIATKDLYTPKQVQSLVARLKSRVKETRIAAAIEFIKNYARIAPTVSKMPLLTVTAVTEKALKAIKENPDLVLGVMVKRKMLKELEFLSSLSQIPPPLAERAKKAADKLRPRISRPVVAEEKPAVVREKTEKFGTPKQYSPLQLEALLSGLDSVDRVRATRTAVEFLKSYSIIADAISKAPMLTVTDVTKKAVKVIEANLNDVLKELEKGKDMAALEFLAESSKFSDETRKRARVVLKILMKPFDET